MCIKKINDKQYYEFTRETGTVLVTEVTIMKKGSLETGSKSKPIANVWPDVTARTEVKDGDEIIHYAKCRLMFSNGDVIEDVDIPIQGIKKVDWITVNSRCILNPDVPKANEHLANIILLGYSNAPVETATIVDRNRLYNVDGVPVYHAGDRLIWPDGIEDKPKVIFKPLPNTRLVVDPNCSEREAFFGMERIIHLSKPSEHINAQNISYVLSDSFTEAGISPRCSMLLIGPTGFKKTTIGKFSTQIYNRDKPLESPSRLDSSIAAAVNRLYERDNVVVMLDDLVEEEMEKTLHMTLRVVGDGIEPGRMRGQRLAKAPPRCGLLYTGEYYFNRGWGSDAARIIPLELKSPIDSNRLSDCQREPLMLSTFIEYFIRWYVTNYDTVCGLLKEWAATYRNTKATCHPRLEEMQACLEMSTRIFLTYAEDRGFISRETAQCRYNSYFTHLREIIRMQNTCVNKSNITTPKQIDYLKIIQTLCNNGCFNLVKNPKDFSDREDDGIIRSDYICFRKERLLKKIKVVEPNATLDEMINYLRSRHVLKLDSNNGSTRKLHGSKLRFLYIRRSLI